MSPETAAIVALARSLGEHALPAFAAGLAFVVLASALGWQLVRHPRWRTTADDTPRTELRLVATLAAGFAAVLLGAGALFAAIARGLGEGHPMVLADHALSDAIGRSVPEAAIRVFAWLTHLGDPLWLTLLCIGIGLLLWRRRRRLLAITWVLAVAGNALLNVSLKQVYERARPSFELLVDPAHGFSFPSGHSSGAMVTYGMLAYLATRLLPQRWHVWAVAGAAAIVFTVACSRVFLRVHFASDVLAGCISGGSWLTACLASAALVRRRHRRRVAAHRAQP